ncbi:diguanylate cyclase [Stutzerimonas kirkiae]|uniref:Diguanylate cyclase n=1 Tax=Stutzerimonas kirkiae TaxID=2211392 RepID=A0A4V6MXD6_9GAMM|nr:ABC transporter substrate-binding protein [Stutzerimonas kirkiae]TBU98875.1 diguanylate cyclase [Stutzerimonas kirkiae]TBV03969.1 diguanylate cyclase [Stutzerimonas kirkiae]
MPSINRRKFLKGASIAGAAAMAVRINPDFLMSSAFAAEGRTLTFYSAENLTGNWDPSSHSTLAQMNLESFVFGTLCRAPMTMANPDELKMELAESITPIDRHTLEITLKKGISFHDGSPFSARDVKATFEYASRPDRPAQNYPGTCKVHVLDDYTCRVDTSEQGYPASLYILLSAFLPIMSANDIEAGSLSQRANGTGPFRFVEQKGNTSVLEAFDGYYLGKPKIPGLNFVFVGDATTRVMALLNGEADLIERLEPEQIQTIQKRKDMALHKLVSVENKYLWFRCSKPPFNDPRVRLAACHAIDREMILELLGEAGHPCASHISPVKFGYTDVPNYPEFDPQKCQALLAEAGYPNGQGLPPLEYITSVGFYPKTQEYGELITAMLQAQGFPVELNVMEVAAWNERLYDRPNGGPGHMIDCGWASGSPEPDLVLRTHFHSSSKRITGIEDKEIDAALDKEQGIEDLEERKRVLQTETLPLLAAKVPSYALFTSVFFHAMRADLKGLFIYPNGQMDAAAAEYV